MTSSLYHVSDRPDIPRFDPRPAPSPRPGLEGDMVWAVDGEHLHNYYLPRNCPRVTFYALPTSTPEDVERFMGGGSARFVVAIEWAWLPEVQRQTLYRYDFAPDGFVCIDVGAGYFLSRQAVIPLAVAPLPDLLASMAVADVELRLVPSLWPLYRRVIVSSLQYSIIRMRNAQPDV